VSRNGRGEWAERRKRREGGRGVYGSASTAECDSTGAMTILAPGPFCLIVTAAGFLFGGLLAIGGVLPPCPLCVVFFGAMSFGADIGTQSLYADDAGAAGATGEAGGEPRFLGAIVA
jgi:hypothetical protein